MISIGMVCEICGRLLDGSLTVEKHRQKNLGEIKRESKMISFSQEDRVLEKRRLKDLVQDAF